jgi:nucleoside-diphosphate-sugar epimerase
MILVTGGTGLVGAHLLLRLVENSEAVRAIHRATSDLKGVERIFSYYTPDYKRLFKKIQWIETDLNDIVGLETAFEHVTHVYHCAAYISFHPSDYASLQKVNVEGTANIVNLCIAKNIQKLCYVSSTAAIGKANKDFLTTEESEWSEDHANVYALSKKAAEMEVWRGTQENLSVVILNPGVIIGPGFWHTGSGTLFTIAHKNRRFFPPGGTGFITVGDVVKQLISLMASPIENERYIAISENLSYEEILKQISAAFGLAAPKRKLKFWELEVLWRLDWLRSFFTSRRRSLTKNAVFSLRHPVRYDHQKIKETLQFTFEPFPEVISFACKKFLEENP